MKYSLVLVSAAGLSFALGAVASAEVVMQFNFDGPSSEGWTIRSNVDAPMTVSAGPESRGTLNGTAVTNGDPQIKHATFGRAENLDWDELIVVVREKDESGTAVAATNLGLLFGYSNPPDSSLGAPTTISAPDADDFYTLIWDISVIPFKNLGELRLDPIGGPDAVGNTFEIDSITFTAVPEPAALGLLGVGGLVLMARRRD